MSNLKNHYHVLIIGSGFSGMAAASFLADYDLNILLLDENIHIGGQLLRRIPEKLAEDSPHPPEKIKKIGYNFVEKVKEKKIDLLNKTVLMGVYENNKVLVERDRKETFTFTYDFLLFATGARERYLPFKGWTLPGVYSTGMLQVLMKSWGVLPAKKMLIAGSGLFLFAAAYEFLKNGGELQGIMEQSPFGNKIKFLPQVFHQFPKFTDGGRYLSKIYSSGVPVKYRRRVLEARGDKQLEEVVVGKVDRKGSLIKGTEKTYSTKALAVGYGFVPSIEAPQLAGCELEYSQQKGGWTVKVNDRMETSVENILAAGEVTGVGGAHKSLNEGKIAASTILEKWGLQSEAFPPKKVKKLQKKRKHHLSFVRCFNSLYKVKPESILEIPDETIVCRCESIDMKQIKEAVGMGCADPNALKISTRCAMGKCQGRTCAPVIYDILQILCRKTPQEIGLFSVRPPFKPISIHALKNFSQ
ncbi:NAD(P)/FAD-dependent oxidoreductase [bacterium]|nr:NAD(P)/FAD-dependent oxidoreductase [bacterium]